MGYFRIVIIVIFLVATGQSNDEGLNQVFKHSHPLTAIQAAHQDNLWWRLLNYTAVHEGYSECYVCANSPHSTDKPFRVQPVSIQEIEFKCLMWLQAMTYYLPQVPCSILLSNISHKLITLGIDIDIFKECASTCEYIHPHDSVPAKAHVKANRDDTMPKAIQVYVKPKFIAPVCVCQNSGIKYKWIGHSRCAKRYVNNNSFWGPTTSSGNMWSMTKSISYILITNDGFGNFSVYADSIIPTSQEQYGLLNNKFWICGNNAYSWLPAQWSGCCYIGYLSTSLTFIPPNDQIVNKKFTRQKRGTYKPQLRISSGGKVLGGFFPWYGTVQNAHVIDNISMELESFANYVIEGFNLLTDQMKSLKLVALQNRAALDYLLAKDGGVCAVIGDQCCTYIPDIDHNMTDVIEHMTRLRDEIENSSEPSTDTDFFSWFGNALGKSLWNLLKDLGACFALIISAILLLYFFIRITICICTTGFKEHIYSPANTNKNYNVYEDIA